MNSGDIDAFFAASRRSLPAPPDWRFGNRAGEQRAILPISVDGRIADISLHLTVRLADAGYLIAVLVGGGRCIARLCVGPGHFDRSAMTLCEDPHFHSWQANRPKGGALPKELRNYIVLPPEAWGRDAGFAWFLMQNSIESPPWAPPQWPIDQGFV